MQLQGATALVSGAAGNIGAALVAELVAHGAKVAGVDMQQPSGPVAGATYFTADLTDASAVEQLMYDVVAQVGQPNVLINTAGTIHNALLFNLLDRNDGRLPLEGWERTVDSNLTTAFLLSREVVARMVKSRTKGVVVHFSSMAADGNAGQSAYSAAKAALESLTVTWSKELGPFGIRVNALAPGFIDTPSTAKALTPAQIAAWTKQIPAARLGTLAEIAHAVRFIIENEYYNGKVLRIDGGLRI